MTDDDIKSVRLTQREVQLLLRYAYPFEEAEEQLNACKDVKGSHTLKLEIFDLEHLIGDFVYSAKNINDNQLLKELDALCDVLENALKSDSRIRGI